MLGYKMSTPKVSHRMDQKWAEEATQDQSHSRLPKSPSGNKSTEMGEPSISYREPINFQMQIARKTITEVINQLRDKQEMNEEALRQVNSVNYEIIDAVNNVRNVKANQKRLSNSSIVPHYHPFVSQFENVDPSQQNIVLRQKLNEQIRKNKQLLHRVSVLQRENEYLRHEKRGGSEASGAWSQNEMLRAQLAQCVSVPKQLLEQMNNLKRQNDELRGDTIALLRRQKLM